MKLRALVVSDVPQIVALNNDNVPAVNPKTEEQMGLMVSECAWTVGAFEDDDATLLGFMLNFLPGTSYQSMNYAWYNEHYPEALFMDRIVVSPAARNRGIGLALYEELFRLVEGKVPMVGVDINLRPPNEGSLRFHQRLGFEEVGRQETDGGNKTVTLMAKFLTPR